MRTFGESAADVELFMAEVQNGADISQGAALMETDCAAMAMQWAGFCSTTKTKGCLIIRTHLERLPPSYFSPASTCLGGVKHCKVLCG